MSEEKYNLVFSGELVRGADPAQARVNLGGLFKISSDQVDALFSGKPKVLKKGLDFATANKYRVAIKKAGCRVDLVEQTVSPNIEPAGQTPSPPPGKAVFTSKELSNNPVSPAERQPTKPNQSEKASDTKEASVSNVSEQAGDVPPLAEVEEFAPEAYTPLSKTKGESSNSGLDITPNDGGNLVTPEELDHPQPIIVSELQADLKAVGTELLNEDEKTPFVARDIAVDASLAPAGSDLLSESEREDVEVVEVDLSEYSVAELGADLEEIQEEKDLKRPDISHLSLI